MCWVLPTGLSAPDYALMAHCYSANDEYISDVGSFLCKDCPFEPFTSYKQFGTTYGNTTVDTGRSFVFCILSLQVERPLV